MTSTTWTGNREQLVRELARARAERDAALARMHAATAELNLHKAKRTDRTREAIARYRQECEREAVHWSAEARELLDTGAVQIDPLAPAHRKQLIDALKEKP